MLAAAADRIGIGRLDDTCLPAWLWVPACLLGKRSPRLCCCCCTLDRLILLCCCCCFWLCPRAAAKQSQVRQKKMRRALAVDGVDAWDCQSIDAVVVPA